jgi:DNA-binding NtrC family response regulator
VPTLRERREDVGRLATHFLQVHAHKLGVPVTDLTPDALAALAAHDFVGNVRELEHAIIRALVFSEPGEKIGLAALPDIVVHSAVREDAAARRARLPTSAPAATSLPVAVARYERETIERALHAAGGNRSAAARSLGISRRWLLRKLEGFERPAPEEVVSA